MSLWLRTSAVSAADGAATLPLLSFPGETGKAMALLSLEASVLVGMPAQSLCELEFTIMPPVGQAVILFGKTLLLDSPDGKSPVRSRSP